MDSISLPLLTAADEARILSHLEDEANVLAIFLSVARELRQALTWRDGERLTQALETEADSLQFGQALRDKRAALRDELAKRLQLAPEEVRLSRLTECVSAKSRATLVASRQRLQEMSDELARLNRQNGAMIRQTLDLTERIVGQLTGSGPHFTAYNAHGETEAANVGPVLQWGG